MQWGEAQGIQSGVIQSDPCSLWGSRKGCWSKPGVDEEQVSNWNLALGMDHDTALARAEHASFMAASILEEKSLSVSRHASINGSIPSQGFCPVSIMNRDEHVEAWTWSL